MGKIITLTNFKGGSSKTTTTQTLAVGLGMKGFKVLVVDSDSQCNLSYISNVETKDNENTIYELMKWEKTPEEVIVAGKYYDIIPGSLSISRADNEFTREPYVANCYYLLKSQLDKVKDKYDFILIDTPPTLTLITQNCLVASDSIIVPTQADSLCISGLVNLKTQLDVITERTFNKSLYIEGILITKFTDRTTLNRLLQEQLFKMAETLNTKLYKYAVRESVFVRECQTLRSNILIENPNHNVSVDYMTFIDEFLKDNGKEVK